MREIIGPPLRAAAFTAFLLGILIMLVNPPSLAGFEDLLTLLGGIAAIVVVTAWLTVRAMGEEMPEPQFRRLVDRSEALASMPAPDRPPSEFDELVISALDELPEDFHAALDHTPVIVSDLGREHHAYGHYIGATIARDGYPDRIVIYQDTLERDFGHDPEQLKAQVQRTVRHEIAHHLGWDESGVRGLGL